LLFIVCNIVLNRAHDERKGYQNTDVIIQQSSIFFCDIHVLKTYIV